MRALAEKGASTAKNPREVADASDVMITMLPSSPHVKSSASHTHIELRCSAGTQILAHCLTVARWWNRE